MRNRSVQFGLIAISTISIAILLLAMFYYYKVQNNQNSAIVKIGNDQKIEMIDQILNIKQEQANAVVHENSAWDELIDYINEPQEDDEWIHDNIGSMSESYDMANIALFDTDGKIIYENPLEEYKDVDFFGELKIKQLFQKSYKNHFFIYHGQKLYEHFGSTVVPSFDINTRKEKPSGYMILIREVNDSLINNYKTALGNIEISIANNVDENYNNDGETLEAMVHNVPLLNNYGNPVAYMCFRCENEFGKILNNFMPMLFIMFGIVLIMFLAITVYSRRYIVKPLMQTAESLNNEDIPTLENLSKNRTEFGAIGRQLITFLSDKNEKERLLKESEEHKAKLTEQYDLLQDQKREIESQIENAKVLNLQIMERNKETERKNVQIVVKNQQLEEQNQNIHNLQSKVAEVEYQLKYQNKSLEKANASLLDNQNYATRLRNVLQVALTPTKHIFSDFFLYSNPKEKIGGDFWFAKKIDNWVIAGVGDCNMQGISGAVLSGVDLYLLDEVLNIRKISELRPDLVLNDLNAKIQNTMGEEFVTDIERDGLHLSMFMYNTETLKGFFAAAKRTMVISRRGEVTEYYGDNLSIGKIHDGKTFNLIPIQLYQDDTVYMYSDGCTEVVGGPFCKKLLAVNFKKEIGKKQVFTLTEQKTQFKKFFEDWVGDLEQTDDITMLTFKI